MNEGDTLPVKVLFRKAPLSHQYIYATYVGFSDQSETYPFSTMLSNEGRAFVKLLKKGGWLVRAAHKIPYLDIAECDEHSYCSTLTFAVK